MNFFAQQEKATRKSLILFIYLGFAIIFVAMIFAILVALIFWFVGYPDHKFTTLFTHPGYIGSFLLGASLVILIPTIKFYRKLNTGGFVVAYMMGGKPINPQNGDFKISQFVNVTEEIAIASGCIMPSLYVMESEKSINAFVAGHDTNDTVLVVTQGALDKLDREELQSVIGHEFSHILNGDIKINMTLTAIICGLTQLTIYARWLTNEDNEKKDYLMAAILYIGGSVGKFAASIISAAVSRQREFLADASSTQYTRDPKSLVDALRKIKNDTVMSSAEADNAFVFSHFFFVSNVADKKMKWFSSHPPIDERILALLQGPSTVDYRVYKDEEENLPINDSAKKKIATEKQVNNIGNVNTQHLMIANTIHQDIVGIFGEAIHDPYSATIIVYGLLAIENFNEAALRAQLQKQDSDQVVDNIKQMLPNIEKLGKQSRFPLLELLFPALRFLKDDELNTFMKSIEKIIDADDNITVFELVASAIIVNQLKPRNSSQEKIKYKTFNDVIDGISCLFSFIAKLNDANQEQVYLECMRKLYNDEDIPVYNGKKLSVKEIHISLIKLKHIPPKLKEFLLKVCESQLLQDRTQDITNTEVLRAIAEHLNCPIPVVAKG